MDKQKVKQLKRDIKLIVIDLDGTLLNTQHALSDRNKRVIKQAIAAGVQVALATGKTRASAQGVIDDLGLVTPGVYVQGLLIYTSDGKVQHQLSLDSRVTRRVIQYAEAQGFDLIAYSGDRLLVKRNEEPVAGITRFHEPEPEAVGSLLNIVADTTINKLIIMGQTQRKLNALRWQLNQQVGDQISMTTASMIQSIEVLPRGAGKGAGVRKLLKLMGIKPQHVMAIGDAENDIEMLKDAGFAVAIGNASDDVKAVADEVVASNDDDGVAEAIETFVLPEPEPTPDSESADTPATETESSDESENNPS